MKITKLQVEEIVKLYASKQQTVSELAEKYGVTPTAINYRLHQSGIPPRPYKRRTWKGKKKTNSLEPPTTAKALPATSQEGLKIKLSEREREALIYFLHQFIELPFEPSEVGGCDHSLSLTGVWLQRWWFTRRSKHSHQIEGVVTYRGKCDCELYVSLIKGRRHLSSKT